MPGEGFPDEQRIEDPDLAAVHAELHQQRSREEQAWNPQSPEQWYIHAVESMGAIGEVERARHGRNETQDYRTMPIPVNGGTGLYTDTIQDDYEVRVQRDANLEAEVEVDEDSFSLDDIIKGVHAKQASTPEFIWRSHRAHVVSVQRNHTEVPLSELEPDELTEHARFLRKTAIIHAATYNNRDALAKLLPPERDIYADSAPEE